MKKKTPVSEKSVTTLVVSDDKQPKVALKPGMKLEVVAVSLVDSQFKKSSLKAARLCGGTSTCVAVIEV
jgi:hypothetical protein